MGVDGIITNSPESISAAINNGGGPSDPGPSLHRLKDGLLAHWAFDEGLTNLNTRTAVDSANNNDAIFTNDLSVPGAWKTGSGAKVGGAIALDGVNDTTLTGDVYFCVAGVIVAAIAFVDKRIGQLHAGVLLGRRKRCQFVVDVRCFTTDSSDTLKACFR